MQQEINYNTYNPQNSYENDELTIDLKKIFYAIWSRKGLLVKVFSCIVIFFVLLTFITPKKYTVDTDLYINNAQSTNLAELNPYLIETLGSSGGGVAALMSGSNSALINEIELIQSPLVIDKVIRENDLKYGKLFGFFPTKKTGEYLSTKVFLLKNISIKNKKGTNVLSIEYKSKNPEVAYNVVNSIVTNYIELHKQLHSSKAQADQKLLEKEYIKAKETLNNKVNQMSGLPSNAVTTGSLSAMSAFSQSASKALATLKGQVIEGQKSQMEVTEEAQKVASLSSKLEWAKLVGEMSESSKVLILKEPKMLRAFENSSPKLFINILLGIVFGLIGALIALIYVEITDKKLTYSMLGENILYDIEKDFSDLKLALFANEGKKVSLITFSDIPESILMQMKDFRNINLAKAEISNEFTSTIRNTEGVILFVKVGETQAKTYKQIKSLLQTIDKRIITEILL